MKMKSRIAALTLILFVSAAAAIAQVTTGSYNYGTFDTFGPDTINVGSLNAHLSIPILNKAGRGIPFYYSLSYDNSIWNPSAGAWTPVPGFGWSGDTVPAAGYVSYAISTVNGPPHNQNGNIYFCPTTYYQGFVYHDPFGVAHPFVGVTINTSQQQPPCTQNPPTPSFTATATDGSGYSLSVTSYNVPSLTSPLGKSISAPTVTGGPAVTVDSNGNEITADGNGHFTDTTGNVVLTIAGSAPSAHTYTYTDTNGNPQTVEMTYKTYTVQTNFGCSGVTEFPPTPISLVNTIVFPDTSHSTYTFTYELTPGGSNNVTGRLASIQLPQGGTISYTYSGGSNEGIVCADGSTAGLTRTLSSSQGSATSVWTYSRSVTGTTSSQTSVTDGLSNSKTYTFVEAGNQPIGATAAYYETSSNVYQGAASGTPVIARNTCYNGSASPCTATSLTLPISQIDTYETLNGLQMHGSTTKFNTTTGATTETDIYDFGGASARGALLSKETWSYGYTIPNLPTLDRVFDGNNTLSGQTSYTYDYPAATPSTDVPSHIPGGGIGGNVTLKKIYTNASTSYALSATYEDTGSVLTSTTPSGKSTLGYDPTFVYNTSVSLPTPSSGVALSTGAGFETTYTGLPLSVTDANSQQTTVATYDSLLRPKEVDSPDGGVKKWSYTPSQVTAYTEQSSSHTAETITEYDGYGRLSRTITANGQSTNPYYQQDTCYDGNGNVSFVSYTYQGTGTGQSKVCTGSGDTYNYDVLGRLLGVSRANGETTSYIYTGRATLFTDENNVQRISQVDGLGRPTIVCEVYSGTTVVHSGSPASCGTDYSPATGFTTTYAYALATGTTTVTQGAQTRTFVSDWLGRPTSVTEPESGTTTYSYTYNSTGLVVTRKRPTANQTSPTVLTTTTTQYDSLNRVVSISYNDGTPTKNFAYDGGPGAGWSDFTQTNPKGRLSTSWIYSGPASAYSYDPVGRLNYLDSCLPEYCGTVADNHLQYYTYDLAGDLLTSSDGGGITSTYTVSTAGELKSLTSSATGAENPDNIISNMQSGPNGPISYSLGNGLATNYVYDALGRIQGGWVCSGNTDPYCAGNPQTYGFYVYWSGVRLTSSSDTALNQGATYGYDAFNRLTARTINSGAAQNYTYTYDRWGNRWNQTVTAGSGNTVNLTFNTSNNQVTTAGYAAYDAAGNMTGDSNYTYTYDAEGNITTVTGGSGTVATYTYDAFNHRIRAVVGGTTTEFVFNQNGQRVSTWQGSTTTPLRGQYYWGSKPVAYYSGGSTHFQHQDWLGTERVRTTYNGSVESTITSLPFGDGQTTDAGGDPYYFAALDYDAETQTDHAQFRQYNSTQGHWMRPDPYYGSYSFGNPQSFNRYTYVLNNPLSLLDPNGKDCIYFNDSGDGIESIDPQNSSSSLDDQANECGANGGDWVNGTVVGSAYNPNTDTWNVTSIDYSANTAYYAQIAFTGLDGSPCSGNCVNGYSEESLDGFLPFPVGSLTGFLQWVVNNGVPGHAGAQNPLSPGWQAAWTKAFGSVTDYCGPDGAGVPLSGNDWSCAVHDYGYGLIGAQASSNIDPTFPNELLLQQINQNLCDMVDGSAEGSSIRGVFGLVGLYGCNPIF